MSRCARDPVRVQRPAPPADPWWLPTLAEEVAWDRREREYETETDDD